LIIEEQNNPEENAVTDLAIVACVAITGMVCVTVAALRAYFKLKHKGTLVEVDGARRV
jgi:hypothetical protein